MALAPIGLLILLAIGVGFLLLLAALVKHGYGKALAIVFGGALSLLVVVAMFASFISLSAPTEVTVQGELSTAKQMAVDVIGKPKIELEKTVIVAPSPVTAEAKNIAEVVNIATKPQEEPEADIPETTPPERVINDVETSDSKPEDSEQTLEEWTAKKSTEDSLILTAEPYLGTVIDGQGKPVKAIKAELMNQLTEWLADKVPGLNYYSNWLDNTPNTTLVNAPTGTTQDELWKRFVADYHITKQTTSVGDTETLSISVTNNGEPMVWISELTKKQNLQRAHDSRLRFYLLGGGGTFIGLVTLYGLLSVGSKESDPTNG